MISFEILIPQSSISILDEACKAMFLEYHYSKNETNKMVKCTIFRKDDKELSTITIFDLGRLFETVYMGN